MATNEGTIFLPKQPVRRNRGRAGYKGKNVKVVADVSAAQARAAAKAEADAEAEAEAKASKSSRRR